MVHRLVRSDGHFLAPLLPRAAGGLQFDPPALRGGHLRRVLVVKRLERAVVASQPEETVPSEFCLITIRGDKPH